MESINAFVAHSFNESDEQVVRKFTDFFDTIKGLSIPFNWDHAEKAEPEILFKESPRKDEEVKHTYWYLYSPRACS